MSFDFIIDILDSGILWIYIKIIEMIKFFQKLNWELHNRVWLLPLKNANSDLYVEVWEISIADGLSGAIHGSFEKINEFYFPELNYSYNIHHDKINHIADSKNRYRYKQVRFTNDSNPRFLGVFLVTGDDADQVRENDKYIRERSSESFLKKMEGISEVLLKKIKNV